MIPTDDRLQFYRQGIERNQLTAVADPTYFHALNDHSARQEIPWPPLTAQLQRTFGAVPPVKSFVMAQSTLPLEGDEPVYGDNYSLVLHNERMRTVIQKEGRLSPREDSMRLHFETLGFWRPNETPSIRHAWDLQGAPAKELESPPKLNHAGKYEWVGNQDCRPPKWLWDSHRSITVRTSDISPQFDGYIAVSYTWGRWKVGETKFSGTPWPVPALDPTCKLEISRLKSVLRDIPCSRYFWVDVLCIDQSNPEELREEIAKQGAIFANASATLTYLWSLRSSDELMDALGDIGKLLLRSLRFSDPTMPDDDENLRQRGMAEQLRVDPYFSSLWTLQESIICPSSIWLAGNGDFCKVNANVVTTAFVAAACYVLTETIVMRFVILAAEDVDDEDTDSERRKSEIALFKESVPWRDWGETDSSIVCSLSSSRSAILLAAAKRVATGRRGEAVLAALKIADDSGSLGEDCKLAPGGLPISLVNRVLQAEGRLFFDVLHESYDGSEFFADMLPTTADSCTPRSGIDSFVGLSAEGFQITDDAFVHIPTGSIMQKFRSFSLSRVRICLQCLKQGEPVEETSEMSAKRFVKSRYKLWRGHQRAMNLPTEIRVKFLPLAVGREKPKGKSDDEELPSSIGLILASDSKSRKSDDSVVWYQCGNYVAYSYKTYKLDWKTGIRVGRWERIT